MKDLHESTFSLRSERAAKLLPYAEISVFEARPKDEGKIRGGIVLVQEIFGVNHHIRSVARHFASKGYAVWAPAFFDHIEKGVELDYDRGSFPKGRSFVEKLTFDQAIEDVKLAAQGLRATLPKANSKIAVVGYCWGGSVVWLATCRLGSVIDAGVSYYGRQAYDFRNEKPETPLIMHFGKHDQSIPMKNVDEIRAAHPAIPVYIYDAGHGFNCSERADYNAEASALAEERTLRFLNENGL